MYIVSIIIIIIVTSVPSFFLSERRIAFFEKNPPFIAVAVVLSLLFCSHVFLLFVLTRRCPSSCQPATILRIKPFFFCFF